MVRIYTAFTKEIDNPEEAAKQILQQLNPAENALKNTIGFIHFYHEYVETEVCEAVVNALPFEVVGCVSSYIGTAGHHGEMSLSVTMITGNDFRFAIESVEGADAKTSEEISDEITRICNGFLAKEKPKVVIPLLTLLPNYNGENLITTASTLPEFIPMFGTVTFNMDKITNPHYVLSDKKFAINKFVFVALYGDFEPKFRVTSSFAAEEERSGDAVDITDADGAILKTVNGMPVLEYLKQIGMVTTDNVVTGTYGIWIIPAVLTYPDGTSVVRAFPGVVEGTEHIYSTGTMKAGAKIKFAHLNGDKTIASAAKLFTEIVAAKENNIMVYSCVARAWSLGTQLSAEAEKIAECVAEYRKQNSAMDYCVAYSGGEICPVKDKDGKLVNALHNYSFASCSFC